MLYIKRKKVILLFEIVITILLFACTDSRSIKITPTPETIKTSISPPEAIDLGIYGKGSAVNMEWSADGHLLAVESSAGGYIYNTATWELVASIPTETLQDNRLGDLTFFPDGQALLFVSGLVIDNTIHNVFWRYDIRTGVISRAFEKIEKEYYERPFFSPDGKLLVFSDSSCVSVETDRICGDILDLYDASTGDLIRRIPENGLDAWEDMSVFAFSPDSKLIATGGRDDIVRVWDVASGTMKYKLQHESDVFSLSFSPDGSVLVSSGDDAAVRFWDMTSGKDLYTLRGSLDEFFQNAAYIDGGKKLLVNYNNIHLYNDSEFKEYSLDDHHLPMTSLDVLMKIEEPFMAQMGRFIPEPIMQFSPDGQTMALLVNSNVQIWDLKTGKKTLTLPEFNREIFSMEFSPDENLLAIADHNIHLWQVSPKKFINTLEINGDQITDIAIHPDGSKIALASNRQNAQVWDLLTYRKILTLEAECQSSHIAYSPDGKKLAVAGYCGIELFDAFSGTLLEKFRNDLGTPVGISFSADGNLLFYVSGYGRKAWNLTTNKQIYSIKRVDDYLENVAFGPGLLAISEWDAPIYFFDPATGKRLYEFASGEGSNVIALSQNGGLLALDNYSRISLLDSLSGSELLSIKSRLAYSLLFSPGSQLLAAHSYSQSAHLWDISSVARYADEIPQQTAAPNVPLTPAIQPTATPAPTLSLSMPTASGQLSEENEPYQQMEKLGELGMGRMDVMAWSADGKTLALGGYSGIYTFEFGSLQPTYFFPVENAIVLLEFSPDGNYLAGQVSNEAIMIWDLHTGKILHKLQDIGCWNREMRFNPESDLLTADCGELSYTWNVSTGALENKGGTTVRTPVSSQDFIVQKTMENVYLINRETGEIIKTFEIPGMAPGATLFSPDGKTLAIWHYQYEVARTGIYFPGQERKSLLQLWNILSDQPPTLRAELSTGKWNQQTFGPEAFHGISFSPDGRSLATASGDGVTQIWDVNSGRLLHTLAEGNRIYFSPDNKHLALMGNDGIRIWDVSSRQPALAWEMTGFNRYPYSIAFAKNGIELISVADEVYKFFNIPDTVSAIPFRELKIPGVRGHNMSVSADGLHLAYNTTEEIFIGESNSEDPNWFSLGKFNEPLLDDIDLALTFSTDGSMLAYRQPYNMIKIWNGMDLTSIELGSDIFISEFLFSPDGSLLLGINLHSPEPSTFYLWDTDTGKIVRQWTSQIDRFAFHPHVPILIGADYLTGFVRFFDLRTGNMIWEIRVTPDISNIGFNPDGSLLVLSENTKTEIRDAQSLKLLQEIPGAAATFAFSPNGDVFVIGRSNGIIEYWGWQKNEK